MQFILAHSVEVKRSKNQKSKSRGHLYRDYHCCSRSRLRHQETVSTTEDVIDCRIVISRRVRKRRR